MAAVPSVPRSSTTTCPDAVRSSAEFGAWRVTVAGSTGGTRRSPTAAMVRPFPGNQNDPSKSNAGTRPHAVRIRTSTLRPGVAGPELGVTRTVRGGEPVGDRSRRPRAGDGPSEALLRAIAPPTATISTPATTSRPECPRIAIRVPAAQARYGPHSGSGRPRESRKLSLGANGARASFSPTSTWWRFSLRELHRGHAATTLSHVCGPPFDLGMTWSTFSAGRPQYWHTQPSRANTARLVSAAWARYGIRTKYRRRTTDGAGMSRRSDRKITPLEARTSALSLSTRTTARLAGTTASG